jgi:hypothetical protein
MITRENYEIYFLDYLEGNLDNALVDDFIEFLQSNPDLKEELHLTGLVNLKAENLYFSGKKNLYKEKYDLETEFNQAAVAYLEGDMSDAEKSEFRAYLLTHPAKQIEMSLYELTKLKAEPKVVFKKKWKLYRHNRSKTIILWASRVAAILALAFLIYQVSDNLPVKNITPDFQAAISRPAEKNETPENANIPLKAEKNQEPMPEKVISETPAKKTESKQQRVESLRESNPGHMDHEKLADARTPVEIPERIPARQVALASEQYANTSLIPISTHVHELPGIVKEERFLGDLVKEKTGLNNLSPGSIARAGLNLVSSISKEKFNYETNPEGQITELSFDSRLLAFSIPTKN